MCVVCVKKYVLCVKKYALFVKKHVLCVVYVKHYLFIMWDKKRAGGSKKGEETKIDCRGSKIEL